MIPIYTDTFRQSIITNLINSNLVSLLITMPSLGLSDSPAISELNARLGLNMLLASQNEIGYPSLNGYYRNIVTPSTPVIDTVNRTTTVNVTSTFTPSAPITFTHICYACLANLVGANITNGNNRGDSSGILIKVEPVVNAPLTLNAGVTFIHNTTFISSTRVF